jgi:hypothetical protein
MHPRKKKLIKPGIQLKVAGVFMGIALGATLVQAFTFNRTMLKVARLLPHDQEIFEQIWPGLFRSSVLLTALVIVLATYCVGVALTHKLFGPIYRFEQYLRSLKSGGATRPCTLRQGDYLQEFCGLLNDATAPLRGGRNPETDETAIVERRDAA